QLLEDLSSYLTFSRKVSNQKGENFNLISLLNMERDEVRTHSRIIGELLNPEGTHGQGNTFLKIFFKQYDVVDFNVDNYSLYLEYSIGKINDGVGGRIDIFLQDNQGNNIIIENKVDAGETNNQLKRYRNTYPNTKIFYLTLFEEEIDEKLKCINITYENDIVNWLENCRKESIDLPVLREALAQYLYLIKKITNQTQQIVMETEIKNRILRDDRSLKDFLELCDFKKEITDSINETFFNDLVKELKSKFKLILVDEIDDIIQYNDKSDEFSFTNSILKEYELELIFQFDKRNKRDFSMGLFFLKDIDYKKEIYLNYRKRIEINGLYYLDHESWLCYKYLNNCFDWKGDQELLNMRNGEALKEICNEVEFMLDLLKN